MDLLTALKKHHTPFASGPCSDIYMNRGKAMKVMEDGWYEDTLKECILQDKAYEAGLAPKIHSVFEVPGADVITMDYINTDRFKHADGNLNTYSKAIWLEDLDTKNMLSGSKLYAKLILAGILHTDFHVGNWFIDGETTVAIDFGLAELVADSNITQLKQAVRNLTRCMIHAEEFDLLHEMMFCRSSKKLRKLLFKAATVATAH